MKHKYDLEPEHLLLSIFIFLMHMMTSLELNYSLQRTNYVVVVPHLDYVVVVPHLVVLLHNVMMVY
jgi:hypothetical protein